MRKIIIASIALMSFSSFAKAATGKYQLVQLGVVRADQFLLDTETGRIWRSVCAHQAADGSCDYSIWESMDVMGISANSNEVMQKIKLKSKQQ